jgi:flagellar hook protein FlgE
MALLNSFNSGVSAVKTFGKSLEVIGDNIANVNTTGFKGSRVTNQDNFSETLVRSSAANGDIPGANSMQIGSGTSVASVSQRFTQGVLSTTGGPADLGISGKGFFKVQDPENQNFYYTRAGDFRLDDAGNLLTNDGMNVMMGTGKVVIPPTQGANPLQSYKIDKNGEVSAYYANGTAATQIGQIFLTSFANPNALERISGNLLNNPGGEAGGVGAAGATQATAANATLFGDIIQGTLELSNVDLTQQFSDLIVAQRAFQAGSRVITVSDSVMEEIVNLKR